MGSLTATGCSLIPGVGDQGSDSDSGTDADQPRDIGTDTGQSDIDADTDTDALATELADLGVLGGNAEACISVTAVVITGSTLAFLAKIDPSGESSQKMANQVQESMKEVPAEIKGDLENLLMVINDSAVDGKTWDDTKFQKAMEPIGAWAKKNCGSE